MTDLWRKEGTEGTEIGRHWMLKALVNPRLESVRDLEQLKDFKQSDSMCLSVEGKCS